MTVDTPAWARDAVFYQVFPDRFASSARVRKAGVAGAVVAPPTFDGYKGGDLLGLAERLDELVDLGITAIYLNPIFSAASNHRYNAYDYLSVDPMLGGDAAFRELLDDAHTRGIRVILDGVFNHTGRGFWPFHHVMEAGGASPYRDWFYLDGDVLAHRRGLGAYDDGRDGAVPARLGYRSWWDLPSLPKLRVEHPDVREYLFSVAEHWLRFGIDGWRLDVPEDIEDETFWPEFRQPGPGRQPRCIPRRRDLGRGARVADGRPVRCADELPARHGDPRVCRRRPARPGRHRRPVELRRELVALDGRQFGRAARAPDDGSTTRP